MHDGWGLYIPLELPKYVDTQVEADTVLYFACQAVARLVLFRVRSPESGSTDVTRHVM